MIPNTYKILQTAVEHGASYGVSRAFKHTDSPTQEQIAELVETYVMNEICEWFNFEEVKE